MNGRISLENRSDTRETHGELSSLALSLRVSEFHTSADLTYGRIAGMPDSDLTRLWEEHTVHEFVTRDTESTLATMVDDAYVNHVPVLTGGFGKSALREFYS